ncbi:MAG: hypothetical protein EA423_01655 [Phycisphaerales bacterium]|nr:MAG: hypothetical protein EA423_01655 [Phycisphaerales bacterium]
MLKFLRKYNKILLVAFGSFLMVAFLAPEAVERIGQQSLNRTTATMDGRNVSMLDRQQASSEREALRGFFESIGGVPIQSLGFRPLNPEVIIGRNTTHWLLLTHAVQTGGYAGESGDGALWLADVLTGQVADLLRFQDQRARQQYEFARIFGEDPGPPPPPERSDAEYRAEAESLVMRRAMQSAGSMRLSMEEFYAALAKAQGVTRMLDSYLTLDRPSRPSSIASARSRLEEVVADVLIIPGRAATPDTSEPDAEVLQALFERYREASPGEGEFGIGYTLPPRAAVQWLVLDRSQIRDHIAQRDFDDIELDAETELAMAGRDRSHEDHARRVAELAEAMLERRVNAAINDAQRIIRTAVFRARDGLPLTGNYYDIPSDWRAPSFAELSARIAREVRIPEPRVRSTGGRLRTSDELAEEYGLDRFAIFIGATPVRLNEVVMRVREIGGPSEPPMQVGLPVVDTPARDGADNISYFLVTDARPTSPPESWEEVRDRLIADHFSLEGYRALLAERSIAVSIAAEDGLEDAMNLYMDQAPEDAQPRVRRRVRVTRRQSSAAELDTTELRAAIFERALALDPGRPVAEQAMSQRVFALQMDNRRSLAIVRINAVQPLTIEDFRAFGDTVARGASMERTVELTGGVADAFSERALISRFNYVDLDADPEEAAIDDQPEA